MADLPLVDSTLLENRVFWVKASFVVNQTAVADQHIGVVYEVAVDLEMIAGLLVDCRILVVFDRQRMVLFHRQTVVVIDHQTTMVFDRQRKVVVDLQTAVSFDPQTMEVHLADIHSDWFVEPVVGKRLVFEAY